MNNETEFLIVILIVIIIIRYNELDETLNAFHETEQDHDFNILPLLYLQLNEIETNECNNLRRLNRSVSQYWFNEICLNMPDIEFKRHFRLTRTTFEWLCCEIIPFLRREVTGSGMVGLA
jgi:hypothetical protein